MKGNLTHIAADGTVTDHGEFNLEAQQPGRVPESVIAELRQCCHDAMDYAGAFSDACKAQAEKYGIKPGALKRYVKALEGDKVDDAEAESEDLLALINRTSE